MNEIKIELKENNYNDCPIAKETILEGLLYVVGDEGLNIDKMVSVLDCSIEDIKIYLDNIRAKYANDNFAIELVNYGGSYKFVSKALIYPFLEKLFNDNKLSSLSQSALETLAIIAYKQPITRIEIEELRGVGSDMMLRKLLARNLIKEVGRSDAPGRPILYEVTTEFLDSFKLVDLKDLPELPNYISQEELF